MSTTAYITALDIHAINSAVLRRAGFQSTIMNESAIESAVMRPRMAAYYESADLVQQAALLISGIALAHAFLDGNKRTALVAGMAFFYINGYILDDTSDEPGRQIEALIARQEDRAAALADFTGWLRGAMKPLTS